MAQVGIAQRARRLQVEEVVVGAIWANQKSHSH